MNNSLCCVASFSLLTFLSLAANAQNRQDLEQAFQRQIRPLLEEHCLECHDADSPEAQLDLSTFEQVTQVTKAHQTWETILERVAAEEMPPAEAADPLAPTDRRMLVEWIRAFRSEEATRLDGDPGPALVRRLSNAEYDYSVRDLTGVDMHPTASFPVDPANEAGFDNSGESLTMSPALSSKILGSSTLRCRAFGADSRRNPLCSALRNDGHGSR